MPVKIENEQPLLNSAAGFESDNPRPDENRLCIETDNGRRKIGDGFNNYNQLFYITRHIVLNGGNATSFFNPSSFAEEGDSSSTYPAVVFADNGSAYQPPFNIVGSWQTL